MYIIKSENRICQGDILENYSYEFSKVVENELQSLVVKFPYIVILTQDCDLEQDYKNRNENPEERENSDKFIQEILFAPAYKAESLRNGEHLKDFDLKMEPINSKIWSFIKSNQHSRYQFFPENATLGITDLVIDFKHCYTVPRDDIYEMYSSKYKISIDFLYREDLSQRFAHYLSRIGFPKKCEIETNPDLTNTSEIQSL